MTRSTPEWIGKDDNAPVPPRVRMRTLERFDKRCQFCGREITTGERWICDHKLAIINGGPNRENNLHPICDWCDVKVKTPSDVKQKSKTYARKRKHYGIRKQSTFRGWRGFDGRTIRNPNAGR